MTLYPPAVQIGTAVFGLLPDNRRQPSHSSCPFWHIRSPGCIAVVLPHRQHHQAVVTAAGLMPPLISLRGMMR